MIIQTVMHYEKNIAKAISDFSIIKLVDLKDLPVIFHYNLLKMYVSRLYNEFQQMWALSL